MVLGSCGSSRCDLSEERATGRDAAHAILLLLTCLRQTCHETCSQFLVLNSLSALTPQHLLATTKRKYSPTKFPQLRRWLLEDRRDVSRRVAVERRQCSVGGGGERTRQQNTPSSLFLGSCALEPYCLRRGGLVRSCDHGRLGRGLLPLHPWPAAGHHCQCGQGEQQGE